ncbi:hypothetical protein APTSU1_001786700 [Apodemus speciosus]|uniref:Uncharacterized protein n=1 Tax=Apodemus speciosus TaxID=105296 RepID=A0ABQ0FTQ2_APOSI
MGFAVKVKLFQPKSCGLLRQPEAGWMSLLADIIYGD